MKLRFLLLCVVLVAACGRGVETGTPTVQDIVAEGEALPVVVCGEASTWVRPSAERQREKWWENGRYAGLDEETLLYPWEHGFFVAYGTASLDYDVVNLSGLWTLPEGVREDCLEAERQEAVLKLDTAEVWLLFYRVVSVKWIGEQYAITVEPSGGGVQFIQFARPEARVPLTVYFVREGDGKVLETIVEAESIYWPYPALER